jgi:hypothetical protein
MKEAELNFIKKKLEQRFRNVCRTSNTYLIDLFQKLGYEFPTVLKLCFPPILKECEV